METEYRYLLHLLGTFLREEAPRTEETADWQKLVHLAQIHSVTGILGYMSMKYPICPEEELRKMLRSQCLNTIALFARRNALAEVISAELEKDGIDHILMKGYVIRGCYPVPELRTFSDIDLVIRPEDRKRSNEGMLTRGFQLGNDWEPVFDYARGKEHYEFHTELLEIDVSDKADYRAYFRQMWEHTEKISQHSFRFTPEFHFLYLLTHIAKHIHGAGAGVRMYLDVAAFMKTHGEQLNWDWIWEELQALKLFDFACVVVSAAESWFGVSVPAEFKRTDPEILEEFCVFTMEAGVFGHQNREEALRTMKHADQDAPAARLRIMLRQVFPAAQTIEKRYTYLQDKPWLLPAAWIHRVIKNRENLGKRAGEARDIFRVEDTEVRRLQKLIRNIGL